MERIEILSTELLEAERPLVGELRGLARKLGIALGWHYLLDLPWAARQLGPVQGMQMLDAGAGVGPMQWWLADHGADVISVDRTDRRDLPPVFRRHYRIQGLRAGDLDPIGRPGLRDILPPRSPRHWRLYPRKLADAAKRWSARRPHPAPGSGTVLIYNQDIASMPDVPDNSLDAVVSISALEHNDIEGLRGSVAEILRVLKPGGRLVATLAAARDSDWFHEPSKGWCYTESSLRHAFGLSASCPSNYGRHDELMQMLHDCSELRDSLDPSYRLSGDNGMPWGEWNPEYVPVGVCKVKV